MRRAGNCARSVRISGETSAGGWMRCKTILPGTSKKLTAKSHEYRLRVGRLRVLFMLESDLISVYRVRDRKEVYE